MQHRKDVEGSTFELPGLKSPAHTGFICTQSKVFLLPCYGMMSQHGSEIPGQELSRGRKSCTKATGGKMTVLCWSNHSAHYGGTARSHRHLQKPYEKRGW